MTSTSSGKRAKMNESLKEMRKGIWDSFRKNYAKSLPNIAIFVLVSLAVGALTMALYYVSGQGALLAVSFLLVPFVFAFQSSYQLRESTTLSGVPSALTRFGTYYSPLNFGSYRLIRNFLWSYLISMAVSYGTVMILVASRLGDPSFAETINSLTEHFALGEMDQVSAILSEEPFSSMIMASAMASMVSYLAFNFYFFFRALPIPYVDGNVKNAPARLKVAIFRGGKRMAGSAFEKQYWYLMWPAFVLAAVFLGLGTYLGYLLFAGIVPGGDPFIVGSLAPLFGFFLAIIPLAFVAPYFFECLLSIQEANGKAYGQYGYSLIRQNLEYLRATERMRQEQASNLEETLKNMEQNDDVIDVEAKEKEAGEEGASSAETPSKDDYGRSDSHRD